MMLSKMMDYMLYEASESKVSLAKDIGNIENYIGLERLRQGNNATINYRKTGDEGDQKIVPLLLLPLVENAFKHGIGLIDDPEIDIRLVVEKEGLLLLVQNKYNDKTIEIRDKTSGIGLVNLERRLKLLYPHKHSLYLSKNGDYFKASLKLNLHDQVSGC